MLQKADGQLIPPLILAHPLAIFPLLAYLPYNFLPAGVVFFIPVLSVLAVLSACAQIVIVYLSWYLKVSTFEEIFATVAGRYGQYGLWAGRAAIITATTGMVVSWLGGESSSELSGGEADSSTPSPIGTIGRTLHRSLVAYTVQARVDDSRFSDGMSPSSRIELINSYFLHYSHPG